MGDDVVTPPPAYSPLTSEFNEFLFAPIGDESNNAVVTVLSAFARLGTDPWQEAARLAQLAAVQFLTSMIAELPNGNWPRSETGAIAARLVELLPRKRVLPVLPVVPRTLRRGKVPAASWLGLVLILVLLAGLIFFAVANRAHAAPASDALSLPPAICGAVATPA